jgi:major intracellular serine protease
MEVKLLDHVITQSNVILTTPEIPDGVSMVNALSLWNEGNEGQGVVVAVLDTGIAAHPDLVGRVIGGRNFTLEYGGDPTNYTDGHFHGTHVAGTIAANRDDIGVVGIAPQVSLLVLKVLDNTGAGSFQSIIDGIDYAIAWRGPQGQRVRIISMSLGGSLAPFTLHDAIKRADAAGIVIVCAAGNEGDGDSTTTEVSYPGYYPECICVGGFDMSGGIAGFSNSNDQIDLVAPAVNILSTYYTGGYALASGTSMSAPHVSGSLALLLNKLQNATNREVTAIELYNFMVNDHTYLLPGIAKTSQGNGMIALGTDSIISVDEIDFADVLNWLTAGTPKMLATKDYWVANAKLGGVCKGDYVANAFKKIYIVQALHMTPNNHIMKREYIPEVYSLFLV